MALSPVCRQLTILVGALFASLSAGGGMGFPSVLLYQLRSKDTEIPLDLDTSSWIGSIHGLAGILAIIAPVVMQWKGRKFTFIAASFILIAGWVIAYMADSITMILLSESLHGFSANVLITVSFDCLSEVISPGYRNNAVLAYSIVNVLGLAMPGMLASSVYWRTICIILGVPATIGILISFFWLESPLWLAYNEDFDKSKINFFKLRGHDDFSKQEFHEVLAAQRDKFIKNRRFQKDSILKHFWREVTTRDFLLPASHEYLLLHHTYWSGSAVVLIYSIELIAKSTQNEAAAFVGGIIISFCLVISSTICNILMKFYKNKPILLLSTCGSIMCLLCVSLASYLQFLGYFQDKSLMTLYFLIAYMITTSLGQVPVSFTLSSELMPVKHRGIGGALFVLFTSLLHASSLKISPYLFEIIGIWGTFLIFAMNSTVCGLLIWKYIPETKGKTLQEIENFYTNGTFELMFLDNAKEHISSSEFITSE